MGVTSFSTLHNAFNSQELFADKTWRFSPEPWSITQEHEKQIVKLGIACHEFVKALELLYMRSVLNKNLLRNRSLITPWVAEYLDRGKAKKIIDHARSDKSRGIQPIVIRPDLLITEDGIAMTEIDSVPGGIGLTAFLNRLYTSGNDKLIGSNDQMITLFYEALSALNPQINLPLIVILVSDEAATYRPEMEWLAKSLQEKGKRVYCLKTNEVMPLGNTLCASIDGNPEQIDIVYRFWELFDLANVPIANNIIEAWEESKLLVSPPMRHFQEEKLGMALFHHHLLSEFWRENLSKESYKLLKKVIPKSWIMDPVKLPPTAVLDAPNIGGRPISSWEQLGEASQKERNLILKISGYHETAWGARSVVYGSDVSQNEWKQSINNALTKSGNNLFILQEYKKPKRESHTIYDANQNFKKAEGRVRLCPYYFVKGNQIELAGILATFCPVDKKIIHGMKDAALLPCCIEEK